MPSELNSGTLGQYRTRAEALTKDTPRRFGTMDVTKMMRHMRNAFETALGETNLPDESVPFLRRVLYFGICHVITTWPGGVLKAPDYWSPPPDHEYDDERRLFFDAMGRFVEGAEREPEKVSAHPILGPMSMRRWQRLNGLHLHHHLRQFGV